MLNENARFLGRLGQHVNDVDELWNFEVQQAYGFTAVPTLDSVGRCFDAQPRCLPAVFANLFKFDLLALCHPVH